MIKIIHAGHYQQVPEGWLDIPEAEQDLTKPLKLENDSVDVLYNEHAWEHLPFEGAVFFAKEAHRVLKKGGILRVCCPCIDKIIKFKADAIGVHYSQVQLKHYFEKENKLLIDLGLTGIDESPLEFMIHSLIKFHNHQHVWASTLIKKVLEKVGFSRVNIVEPGTSLFEEETELERVIRGVNPEYCLKEFNVTHYDPESIVIEAKK